MKGILVAFPVAVLATGGGDDGGRNLIPSCKGNYLIGEFLLLLLGLLLLLELLELRGTLLLLPQHVGQAR